MSDDAPAPAEPEKRMIVLYPEAFIKILLHAYRFLKRDGARLSGERVYGFLLGREEDGETHVLDVEPVTHGGKSILVFDDVIHGHASDINRSNSEAGLYDRVKGFYATHTSFGLKFTASEIKNLIPFQNADPNCVGMVVDVDKLDDIDCFRFYSLEKGQGGFYSAMSEYHEVPWRMETFGDVHKILQIFRPLISNITSGKPLITEIDEY
ncbi:MAG: hypothetical protein ACTSU5_16910 [Promethearchaeota archaeon]